VIFPPTRSGATASWGLRSSSRPRGRGGAPVAAAGGPAALPRKKLAWRSRPGAARRAPPAHRSRVPGGEPGRPTASSSGSRPLLVRRRPSNTEPSFGWSRVARCRLGGRDARPDQEILGGLAGGGSPDASVPHGEPLPVSPSNLQEAPASSVRDAKSMETNATALPAGRRQVEGCRQDVQLTSKTQTGKTSGTHFVVPPPSAGAPAREGTR
jgi:hypothetical protein